MSTLTFSSSFLLRRRRQEREGLCTLLRCPPLLFFLIPKRAGRLQLSTTQREEVPFIYSDSQNRVLLLLL